MNNDTQSSGERRHLARSTLSAFVLTFLASRILVLLIMTRRIPDLFLHVGGTHVHHLNYGIFLLSAVGAYLLFGGPQARRSILVSVLYGIGLALTFDEFGMWLHLGGGYWQRASFDAIVIVAAILVLIAYAPNVRRMRAVHWIIVVCLLIALPIFGGLLRERLSRASEILGPRLRQLEAMSPR